MSFAYRASAVAAAFQTLLNRIQLSSSDAARFASHRSSVRAALIGADGFDLNRLETIGSFARQTAVRRTSDADLIAVLRRASVTTGGALQTSHTVLSKLRSVLCTRFWQTAIVRDAQAVVLDFGDGSHPVDVVPAVWEDQSGFRNHPVFLIPDGAGGWMATSPTSHNRFLAEADARAGGKLTYTAQLVKFWCATRATPVPLSGFHIELLLAGERLCEGARSYSSMLCELFALLANRQCAALNDPISISGRIAAARTDAKRASAIASVEAAADHAERAVAAERRGQEVEAMRQWDLVFNGCFTRWS